MMAGDILTATHLYLQQLTDECDDLASCTGGETEAQMLK